MKRNIVPVLSGALLAALVIVAFPATVESGPNFGRVEVITRFGPPPVPVPNKLTLQFGGGTTARRADHMPVMGPNLTVGIANHSAQPVEVSLGVFASK